MADYNSRTVFGMYSRFLCLTCFKRVCCMYISCKAVLNIDSIGPHTNAAERFGKFSKEIVFTLS